MHFKSHALPLMSYINRLEVESMRRTHLLSVWFAANLFPDTMLLDQSAVNYTAQRRSAISQAADHVSVHCKYKIIIIGVLKSC